MSTILALVLKRVTAQSRAVSAGVRRQGRSARPPSSIGVNRKVPEMPESQRANKVWWFDDPRIARGVTGIGSDRNVWWAEARSITTRSKNAAGNAGNAGKSPARIHGLKENGPRSLSWTAPSL